MSEYSEQDLITAINKSQILDQMYVNPKTKGPLLAALKEVRPDLSIPEIDTRNAVLPELEATRRELLEVKAERAADRIKNQYGMSDSEFVETISVMKNEGIQNVDTAVELQRPRAAASPRSSQASPIQLPNIKEIFNDTNNWARREALQTIED